MTVKQLTEINGIDIHGLKCAMEDFRERPPLAKFQFRAHNKWLGRCWGRSRIKDFYGFGKENTARTVPYVLENDEPEVFCGEDRAPNPVEYVLHALAGCVTTTIVAHAASQGIEIDSVESSLEGDIDVRGFLDLSEDVPRGYKTIRMKLKVKSDAPAEKLTEFAKLSPVYNTLTNPTSVELTVEKV